MSMMGSYLKGFLGTRQAAYDRALRTELASYNPEATQRQILELQKMKKDILEGDSSSSSLAQRNNSTAVRLYMQERMSKAKDRRQDAKNYQRTVKSINDDAAARKISEPEGVAKFRIDLLKEMKKHAPDAIKKDDKVTPANFITRLKGQLDAENKTESQISKELQSIVDYAFKSNKNLVSNYIDTYTNRELADKFLLNPDADEIMDGDKPLSETLPERIEAGRRAEIRETRRGTSVRETPVDPEQGKLPYLRALQGESTEADTLSPEASIALIDSEIQRLEGQISEGPDLTRFQSRTPFGFLSNVDVRETGLPTSRFAQHIRSFDGLTRGAANIIQRPLDARRAKRFDLETFKRLADEAEVASDDERIIESEKQKKGLPPGTEYNSPKGFESTEYNSPKGMFSADQVDQFTEQGEPDLIGDETMKRVQARKKAKQKVEGLLDEDKQKTLKDLGLIDESGEDKILFEGLNFDEGESSPMDTSMDTSREQIVDELLFLPKFQEDYPGVTKQDLMDPSFSVNALTEMHDRYAEIYNSR